MSVDRVTTRGNDLRNGIASTHYIQRRLSITQPYTGNAML